MATKILLLTLINLTLIIPIYCATTNANMGDIQTETSSSSYKLNCIEDIRVFNALEDTKKNWSALRYTDRERENVFSVVLASYHSDVIINEKSSEHSGSAILLAIEDFCGANNQLTSYTFDIILANDECKARGGVPNMLDLIYGTDVDVIIGMACSEVSIAMGYFLSYHDIPLISHASNSIVMNDKSTYNILTRMGLGFKHIGLAFVDIFREFKWNRVVAFATGYGLCEYASGSIQRAFLDEGISMPDWLLFEPENFSDEMLREALISIKQRARVIYVCMWRNSNLVKFFAEAKRQGMLTPEYTYITTVLAFIDDGMRQPWTIDAGDRSSYTDEEWQARKDVYKYLKIVTTSEFKSEEDREHQDRFYRRNQEPPFNWDLTNAMPPRNGRIMTLYDIATHWLNMVNSSVAEGSDPRSGRNIFNKMALSSFTGITGEVVMDEKSDRIAPYLLWQYKPGQDEYTVVAHAIPSNPPEQKLLFVEGESIEWGTADGLPPVDTPPCGFFNEFCPPEEEPDYTIIIIVSCFGGLAFLLIVLYLLSWYIRKRRYDESIQKMLWKIEYADMEFRKGTKSGSMSKESGTSRQSLSSAFGAQLFANQGFYRGTAVAVKQLVIPEFYPDKQNLIRLKELKDMAHDNVNAFLGLSVVTPNVYIVTSYCSRGSLQDVLENDDIKLDKAFKISLLSDLVNGMKFIHGSSLQSHGHLKSSSCLVTSRWVLKISNTGTQWLKTLDKSTERVLRERDLLWRAPELLRMEKPPLEGTQKGDVYSYAIIMQEILFRLQPFMDIDEPVSDIITKVKKETEIPYRPKYVNIPSDVTQDMVQLMEHCWHEQPSARPTFQQIGKEIIKFNNGRKINIMDNMVAKLESYANNLEDIVAHRTEQLVLEKKKTDQLLYRMLPEIVAEKLKIGETVPPELFDSATIYFSDVVGFTTISAKSLPIQVVDLLNDLYTCFDAIIDSHDVYKVETIGDAYMCVSGIPLRNGNRHAAEICNMALGLREAVSTFVIRHLPDTPLQIRIGVHTGSCAAGVVGQTMPRYCLFGDTVNTASRMESNSETMKIHLSEFAYNALEEIGGYDIDLRGEIEVKGKGTMKTYWLNGKL